MPQAKVDNSHLALKRAVRLRALDMIDHTPVRVLDAYAGLGTLWRDVREHTDRQIAYVGVDKRYDTPREMIRGDNRRVLRSADLDAFDLIDLDAYGIPFEQLTIVADRAPHLPVLVTATRDRRGGYVPKMVARRLGLPWSWARDHPVAVQRLGWWDMWDGYCYALGYRRRIGYTVQDDKLKRYDLLLPDGP